MKRFLAGMAATLLAAILFAPCHVLALSAENAICVDGQTGRILYEKNGDKRSLIASTTKIMTALIICEQCNVLDRVQIPVEAVGIEGSSMYLRQGEILTVQELLFGLMLQSGNDAAVALAIYCGGTVEGFVELMNDKAHRLGLENTHFVNPHGLDAPEHYSTARDLAALADYAMKNPIFAKTVSAKTVQVGQRTLRNHNRLLWTVKGTDGVKTGFTKAAGRILVSSATRDGRRLLTVTVNAPDDWNDHSYLIEGGFSQYTPQLLIQSGACLGEIPVAGGMAGKVQLMAAEDFSFALADGEVWNISLPEPGFVYAPVQQGKCAGYAHIFLDGTPIGKIRMVYGQNVEQMIRKRSFLKKIFGGE